MAILDWRSAIGSAARLKGEAGQTTHVAAGAELLSTDAVAPNASRIAPRTNDLAFVVYVASETADDADTDIALASSDTDGNWLAAAASLVNADDETFSFAPQTAALADVDMFEPGDTIDLSPLHAMLLSECGAAVDLAMLAGSAWPGLSDVAGPYDDFVDSGFAAVASSGDL
jgi:hypothetical protein